MATTWYVRPSFSGAGSVSSTTVRVRLRMSAAFGAAKPSGTVNSAFFRSLRIAALTGRTKSR